MTKYYRVTRHDYRKDKDYSQEGTLTELVKAFYPTLEVGAAYQHERGNSKINRNPKTIESLVNNLNKAKANAASNGDSGCHYSYQLI